MVRPLLDQSNALLLQQQQSVVDQIITSTAHLTANNSACAPGRMTASRMQAACMHDSLVSGPMISVKLYSGRKH